MAISKKIRQMVYNKYNGHCAYCGEKIEYKDMQVDHLIPLAGYKEKGMDAIGNLMPSCRICNHYKRANTLEGFRRMIQMIPDKLKRDSYIYRIGVKYGNVIPSVKEIQFFFEMNDATADEYFCSYGSARMDGEQI